MPQPKKRNPAYRPAWETEKRYRIIYGGSGSGKSVYAAQEETERARKDGDHFILLVRKNKNDVRTSCFEQVKKVISANGWRGRVKIRRQEMRISFPNGAEMLGVGLDDPGKLKSIVDPTRVWIEEANQINQGDFEELNRRLRGKTHLNYQLTLTFNPAMSRTHWIRKRWFEDGQPIGEKHTYETGRLSVEYKTTKRAFIMRTTHEHNPWVDDEYGETLDEAGEKARAVYKRGTFYDSDDPEQLIKTDWVEAAFGRDLEPETPTLGVDVARFGDDDTVILAMDHPIVREISAYEGNRTTETASKTVEKAEEHGVPEENVVVDTGGLGAGTGDTLYEMDFDFQPVKYGESPIEDSEYKSSFFTFENLRSQMWWHLRRLFLHEEIAIDLPPDSSMAMRLQSDVTAPRYDIRAGRKIIVEPKEGRSDTWGVKARLGRSPDTGDALIQAAFAPRLTRSKNVGGSLIGKRGSQDQEAQTGGASLVGKRR